MKTFKKIQTLIERANKNGIKSKILHMDGQITAYKDMLYHLQGLDITAAISKCEHNLELVRHNRELLRQVRGRERLTAERGEQPTVVSY